MLKPLYEKEDSLGTVHKNWDSEWWKKFLELSEDFTKTLVIRNVLTDAEVNQFNRWTLNALREVFLRQNTNYDFRLYIGSISQSFQYLKENLFIHLPKEDDTPHSWAERVFCNDEKFAIIMNSSEKFSDEMATKISEYYAPLIEIAGIPLRGINITIFIGNYGFTPLGIHKDHPGEHVMHLHLGPANKIMYNWDLDEYEKMTNNVQNNKNVTPLLAFADKYEFGTKDIYYMPWNKYHIGNTEEMSVGISIWFNHLPYRKLLPHMLRSFRRQIFSESNQSKIEFISPFLINNDDASNNSRKQFEQMIALFDEGMINPYNSFGTIIREVYEDYCISLSSNQGWNTVPISRDKDLVEGGQANMEDVHFSDDDEICAIKPFKIKYKKTGQNTISLFIRGNKIDLKFHPEIIKVIETINLSEPISVGELLERLNQSWPREVGVYILKMMYNLKGITLNKGEK
ncbi:hypothetical protein ACS126_18695 [Sphingobacterium lactis]|uniref:hypothetical protein n=1 Tax=Sphingobacterium lactis TaxID=797291 RepID=UPI003EC72D58